jgi:hypothetical protein
MISLFFCSDYLLLGALPELLDLEGVEEEPLLDLEGVEEEPLLLEREGAV